MANTHTLTRVDLHGPRFELQRHASGVSETPTQYHMMETKGTLKRYLHTSVIELSV